MSHKQSAACHTVPTAPPLARIPSPVRICSGSLLRLLSARLTPTPVQAPRCHRHPLQRMQCVASLLSNLRLLSTAYKRKSRCFEMAAPLQPSPSLPLSLSPKSPLSLGSNATFPVAARSPQPGSLSSSSSTYVSDTVPCGLAQSPAGRCNLFNGLCLPSTHFSPSRKSLLGSHPFSTLAHGFLGFWDLI